MPEKEPYRYDVIHALELCLCRQVQFAIYRLPGGHQTTLIIQKDMVMSPLPEIIDSMPGKGFLVAPFSMLENQAYLIKPDIIIRDTADRKTYEALQELPLKPLCPDGDSDPSDTLKTDYLNLINDSIGRIENGEFEKVVLSRIKTLDGDYTGRLTGIFASLRDAYPNAFVYLFHVNGQCWTGATPEPFACARQGTLHTVSMAGTRPYSEDNLQIDHWNPKEIQEQEYVTLHIEKILKQYKVSPFERNGPYVARAGNLLHLRTDFNFSARSVGNNLPALIHALHPTPAVCGMSTHTALEFISHSEKHNREYYTGFLGPVGIDDLIQLYVNLRCLKVYKNRLVLYIGGGITHDSVPEEEWEETEIKADTLLSVLKQIQ